MISARMLPHTITITTPVEVDAGYNNVELSYRPEDGATTRTAAAYVRPMPGGEDTVDRDAVERLWRVHANDLAVTAVEQIVFNSVVYEIDGEPEIRATKPGGGAGHTKLKMRRVDG